MAAVAAVAASSAAVTAGVTCQGWAAAEMAAAVVPVAR